MNQMNAIKLIPLWCLVVVMLGCTNGNEKTNNDYLYMEVNRLFGERNFKKLDELLSHNAKIIENNVDFAEYQLHRNISRWELNPSSRDVNSIVFPLALWNHKEDGKTSWLSQSYQEYILMLQGTPKFVDGYCPDQPISAACNCRESALINNNYPTDYFYAQRDMWFSDYLGKVCPSNAIKTLHLFSTIIISENKATSFILKEKRQRSAEEFKIFEDEICDLRNTFRGYEVQSVYFDKSNVVNCKDRVGDK